MLDAMPRLGCRLSDRTTFLLGRSRARLGILLVLAVLLAPAAARADGDPASDVLYPYSVFYPFDVRFADGPKEQLTATVEAAQKRGYQIKVAIITKPADLGAVGSLFGKPQEYASFLGRELAPFFYKGRLLVVMASGYGVYHYRHSTDREQALVGNLTVGIDPTPTEMVISATAAVRKLAAAAGRPLPPIARTSGSSTGLVIVIAAVVAGGLVLGGGVWLWLRRRRPAR